MVIVVVFVSNDLVVLCGVFVVVVLGVVYVVYVSVIVGDKDDCCGSVGL